VYRIVIQIPIISLIIKELSEMKCFTSNTLTLIISILLALTIAELALRTAGYTPFSYAEPLSTIRKMWSVFDPVLGWRMSPGNYTQQAGFNNIVDSDGSRSTSDTPHVILPRIVIVGGSFTFGSGVPDEHTFAWKLQSAFPLYNVKNFGTGGYGTYQSLLRLEEYFASNQNTDLVIYGYLNHHQERNVASSSWMHSIEQYSRRYNHMYIPYCTWDNKANDIIRHVPSRYPHFPFREMFALSALLERTYTDIIAQPRTAMRGPVTSRLLQEMQRLSKAHGADFLTLIVDVASSTSQERREILDVISASGVDYVDCIAEPDPALSLWDGHPSQKRHSQLAQCLIDYITARYHPASPLTGLTH